MASQSVETKIGSYAGKLIRDHFGRGPKSVYVSIKKPFITIFFQGFLVPMEQVLLRNGHEQYITEIRDHLMEELLPDIRANLRYIADLEVANFYYDWTFENETGLILGVLEDDDQDTDEIAMEYENREKVHEEIDEMSKEAEKVPESSGSVKLNDRTLVIERNGILVEIEKELIRDGFETQLRISKRQLERRRINQRQFSEILNAEVIDTFVDWNFSKDKSYIVFILKPNQK